VAGVLVVTAGPVRFGAVRPGAVPCAMVTSGFVPVVFSCFPVVPVHRPPSVRQGALLCSAISPARVIAKA
jgi:hypothetical protein